MLCAVLYAGVLVVLFSVFLLVLLFLLVYSSLAGVVGRCCAVVCAVLCAGVRDKKTGSLIPNYICIYTKYMSGMWNPCHISIYTTSNAGSQIYAVNIMHM